MAWINNYQVWLSESQSLKNGQQVADFLIGTDKGWTKESISALIGNMRHESSINPNMYEYGYSWGADRGFGLVQWTPRSKFWNWGVSQGYAESELKSGDSQLARIDYEVDNDIQYIANGHALRYGLGNKYDFSFADFRANTNGLSVSDLTEAFMWNYEGPAYSAGTSSLSERQNFANRAFNELDWTGSDEGGGDTGGEPLPNIDELLNNIGGLVDGAIDAINQRLLENMVQIIDDIFNEFIESFNSPIYLNSESFKSNRLFILQKLYGNVDKISPTSNLTEHLQEFMTDKMNGVGEGLSDVFDNLKDEIRDTEIPIDNKPKQVMYFPVDYNIEGINFFTRAGKQPGTLEYEMTYGERTGGFHSGYDIGSLGQKVKIYAVRDGVVTWSGFKSGGIGNCIYIEHTSDEFHSNYMHLDSMLVEEGDTVKAGQEIGIMGNSGGDYAIHLHFEVSPDGNFHSGGNTINPEPYLEVTGDKQTRLPRPV